MQKAGGILGIAGGIAGLVSAALLALILAEGVPMAGGGMNGHAWLGWAAILASLLGIASGALALARPRQGGIALIVIASIGVVLGGIAVSIVGAYVAGALIASMLFSLFGGALAAAGAAAHES